MKKFAACLMLLAMLVSMGCCTRVQSNGQTTKTFLNCLTTAQSYVCNPPANVMAIANEALPLLIAVLNTCVPGSALYTQALSGANAATNVAAGLCVAMTDLNNMIAVLQGSAAATAQAKMLDSKKLAAPVNIQPLINWAVLNGASPKY